MLVKRFGDARLDEVRVTAQPARACGYPALAPGGAVATNASREAELLPGLGRTLYLTRRWRAGRSRQRAARVAGKGGFGTGLAALNCGCPHARGARSRNRTRRVPDTTLWDALQRSSLDDVRPALHAGDCAAQRRKRALRARWLTLRRRLARRRATSVPSPTTSSLSVRRRRPRCLLGLGQDRGFTAEPQGACLTAPSSTDPTTVVLSCGASTSVKPPCRAEAAGSISGPCSASRSRRSIPRASVASDNRYFVSSLPRFLGLSEVQWLLVAPPPGRRDCPSLSMAPSPRTIIRGSNRTREPRSS